VGDRIAVGVIRKPHGVHGEASVEPWTDSAERFEELKHVTLVSPDESRTREATIESVRIHGGRALVKLDVIASPEDCRQFAEWTIEIPEADARKLEPGEYFLHDLAGLTLIDSDGRERGKVVGVEESGGGILLVVDNGKRRFDVPFAAEICTKIDLATNTIAVTLPEGLDEI